MLKAYWFGFFRCIDPSEDERIATIVGKYPWIKDVKWEIKHANGAREIYHESAFLKSLHHDEHVFREKWWDKIYDHREVIRRWLWDLYPAWDTM
jgi:hypothetical protein